MTAPRLDHDESAELTSRIMSGTEDRLENILLRLLGSQEPILQRHLLYHVEAIIPATGNVDEDDDDEPQSNGDAEENYVQASTGRITAGDNTSTNVTFNASALATRKRPRTSIELDNPRKRLSVKSLLNSEPLNQAPSASSTRRIEVSDMSQQELKRHYQALVARCLQCGRMIDTSEPSDMCQHHPDYLDVSEDAEFEDDCRDWGEVDCDQNRLHEPEMFSWCCCHRGGDAPAVNHHSIDLTGRRPISVSWRC